MPFERLPVLFASGKSVPPAALNRWQSTVKRVIDAILDKPELDSVLIEDVELTAATTVLVEHRLDRAFRGWRIVDIDAAATVHRDATSTANASTYLPLQASANCTVALLVF